MFDQSGHVMASTQNRNGEWVALIATDYIEVEKALILKEGDPLKGEGRLTRVYRSMSRIKDGKILAEAVQYRRAGGDGLYWGHHTQKTCPDGPIDLSSKLFIKQTGGDQ